MQNFSFYCQRPFVMIHSLMETRLVYRQYGKPTEVLECETFQLAAPAKGEATIEMLYANINPSDLGMIGGSYGKLLSLPATAGREGVGRIREINGTAAGLAPGDLVRIPESSGTWQSACNAPVSSLYRLPEGMNPEQASTLFINPPTALLLLESILPLKAGDWIVQNAANSAVGTAVIQIAKHMGLKTLNVVRRPELIEPLKALGADAVVLDHDDYPKQLKEITGGSKPRLALNSVGGESVNRLIKSLADGGICVTFGGMVGDPIRFPTRFLIFNGIQLRGFWMDQWYRNHSPEEGKALLDRLCTLWMQSGMKTPVEASFSLADYRQALEAFTAPRLGKVLFRANP
jgi:NADPH:quinone reductase-like Zn-dependent oxidoreductase